MNKQSPFFDEERRSHYRVNDDVYLEYLVLDTAEVANAVSEFEQESRGHFNPLNQLQAITIRQRPVLESLQAKWPEIGAYFASIDERIQLLAHAIAQDQVGVPIVPNESVNISAGGISFASEQSLDIDAVIEFSIIIVPSYLHIYALGKVVYCRKNEAREREFPLRIGVEFSHIHEADRDALIRHVQLRKDDPPDTAAR